MDTPDRDLLTERVIGLGIAVHRALGPGLLESAYEECLCFELAQAGMAVARQVSLPVVYKSVLLDCGYRLDLVVENRLIVDDQIGREASADPRRASADLSSPERS